jgi:acyl carrier protein
MEAQERISELVLTVHRRNGGALARIEPGWRLLEPALRIDSLDLAEIMVAVEREFGCSPFDAPRPPRTWDDVVAAVAASPRGRAGTDSQRA